MLATFSRAWASEISIRRPATTGLPSSPMASCPARSRCSLIRLSIYSFRSSRFDLVSIATAEAGKLANFGRSCSRVACNAGSCERIKVVFVVSGACLEFVPASTPTRSWRAAGLDVKNDKSKGFLGVVFGSSVGPSDLAVSTVDRIHFNWEMTASFRAHSSFNDRLSFRVSRSFLRCAWMVSGVGVSGEVSKERPYEQTSQCRYHQGRNFANARLPHNV